MTIIGDCCHHDWGLICGAQGRLHFDIILVIALVISVVLMVFTFITGGRTRNNGLFAAWCILWVFLSIFAWIAQKVGVQETTYV